MSIPDTHDCLACGATNSLESQVCRRCGARLVPVGYKWEWDDGMGWLVYGILVTFITVSLMYGIWRNPRAGWDLAVLLPYVLLPVGMVMIAIGGGLLMRRWWLHLLLVPVAVLVSILALNIWFRKVDQRDKELRERPHGEVPSLSVF